MELDYSLYLVTDRNILKGRPLCEAVEQAILGGVTLVQLREKDVSTREFYKQAVEVKKITENYNIPLIINDRLDIAQAVDAEGVHLGQSDMPLIAARNILGKSKIIGISVGNIEEAVEAEKNSADYIGIGTIFFTGTKKDIELPIGIEGLKKIYNNINIPAVAIGGINENNFREVLSTGIEGISVVSAILGKNNIKAAAETLHK